MDFAHFQIFVSGAIGRPASQVMGGILSPEQIATTTNCVKMNRVGSMYRKAHMSQNVEMYEGMTSQNNPRMIEARGIVLDGCCVGIICKRGLF
jgi:hypothetical protein